MKWYEKMMERAHAKGKTRLIKDREGGSVYLERLTLIPRWATFGLFHVCLHKFWRSDDPADGVHNHPWPFFTYILKGGYSEWLDDNSIRRHEPGSSYFAKKSHFHRVDLHNDSNGKPVTTWTLFIMGPRRRKSDWGFKVGGQFYQYQEWLELRKLQAENKKKREAEYPQVLNMLAKLFNSDWLVSSMIGLDFDIEEKPAKKEFTNEEALRLYNNRRKNDQSI